MVLHTSVGQAVAARIADPGTGLHVPHLADLEVVQAMRRSLREKEMDAASAAAALKDLRELDLHRHAHEPLLDRIWELRGNVSAYDAVYIALAEVLGAVLLTCDARLARSPGAAARVEVVRA
ncbi:MAG TPA: type II toxin-antitoxin system VapC family toxin [Thermoanaerobaculia bacterium]|nr:type II toxin-antitoxin system VapC family toxin [Thermoanaerobaculia bacterium]